MLVPWLLFTFSVIVYSADACLDIAYFETPRDYSGYMCMMIVFAMNSMFIFQFEYFTCIASSLTFACSSSSSKHMTQSTLW